MGPTDPPGGVVLGPADFPFKFQLWDLEFTEYDASCPPAELKNFLSGAAFPAHKKTVKAGAHKRVIGDHREIRRKYGQPGHPPLGGYVAWYTPKKLGRPVIVGYVGLIPHNHGADDGTVFDAYITDLAILAGIGGSGLQGLVLDFVIEAAQEWAVDIQAERKVGFLVSRDVYGNSLGALDFRTAPQTYDTKDFGPVRLYHRVFRP